jgi:hypothetical protein
LHRNLVSGLDRSWPQGISREAIMSQMLGSRAPGSSYGGRDNGPPVNEIANVPAAKIPTLPNTPSPKPMPNLPITDMPNQNPSGPQ